MDKTMLEVRIYTDEGKIFIEQPVPNEDAPNIVMVSSEQVDALIGWLKEARSELEGNPTT